MIVAGGCNGWCADNQALADAEMYDLEANEWRPVKSLPEPLSSAKLELLNGKPTTIGGWNNNVQNGYLYQYDVDDNEWKAHPEVKLRIPRSSAAVFQVPREPFKC